MERERLVRCGYTSWPGLLSAGGALDQRRGQQRKLAAEAVQAASLAREAKQQNNRAARSLPKLARRQGQTRTARWLARELARLDAPPVPRVGAWSLVT
ncbi:hypothetical protein E2562_035789 [Oryza meyeriana var. granulata]|uniref:Uncharacterized protein n=1 Tax=Oryza meyeriana var. granulata TaxID=110450 RepID=A0A6G1CK73_9ORYZ|nr:hypothetical protein E2562_035789 [Oryza meyeriana var. granulata]